MLSVGLVACAKTKSARKQEAKDLYLSHLFLLASRYCAENYAQWHILSARYGLLSPLEEIEPYDETLGEFTPPAREKWAERVIAQARRLYVPEQTLFHFHAGGWYAKLLAGRIGGSRLPLAGLGIGRQIAWYLDRL
jgi:hypothetical protein